MIAEKNPILIVSVLTRDRPGLIADIAGYLHDQGASLGEMSFSVLGEGADFTALCSFTDPAGEPPDANEIESGLRQLPDMTDANISVLDFKLSPYRDASDDISHHVEVRGVDRPGLVARLCEVLFQHKANVIQMNAETLHGMSTDEYVITMDIALPARRSAACLAALGNTAEDQGLSYSVTPMAAAPA